MTIQPGQGALVAQTSRDGIVRVTLNNPARRNALSEAMLDALSATFAAIAADKTARVVILAAVGPAFSAGHDLKELSAHRADPDRGRAYFADIMGRCAALMQAITRLPQPVIAEVAGVATAAGCQLVASCDLAIAAETARFATPGVSIGLFCSTPMVALTRNLAAKHAMEMLLTGEMVDAAEAYRLGLVNRVVSADALESETMALAARIAGRSTLTVKIGKEAFYRQREMPLDEAYAYAASVMVENMLARDAEEGICAFLEKRDPRWEDR
jgi:enoyl-CoA hydratase/carnithine racemase